ncbi:hypothetical protein BDF19DRAFT_435474 [Syncephalis fuscata]|nr:hypothetical protein BDF19DRAFT_435474 [Syncephalis fuscata]
MFLSCRLRQFHKTPQSPLFSVPLARTSCSAAQSKTQKTMQVILTEPEEQLCQLLDSATKWLHERQPDQSPVELRIAGGWVRDKLLGLESHDLDIAIDSMTGFEFAQRLAEYQQSIGKEMKSIARIASNPERSKHLETATSVVLGLSLDFVHLRCEEYQENSRIPNNVSFGTPTQDAYRRDVTINTLFYNVHSRQVEDFTNMGLRDLQQGVVRTPLAPYETFKDDPLRVLRCIRFASRFNFEIASNAYECMKDTRIKTALQEKISRERIGVEMGKMLQDNNPIFALTTLYDTNLYDAVFALPNRLVKGELGDSTRILPMAHYLKRLLAAENNTHLLSANKTERYLLYLSTAVSHYRSLTTTEQGKKRMVPAAYVVVKESLKLSVAEAEQVSSLIQALELAQETVKDASIYGDRASLGKRIRHIAVDLNAKSHWRLAFILALVDDLTIAQLPALSDEEGRIIKMYEDWMKAVESFGLLQVHTERYLIDGKEVAKLFNIRPGPQIKELLEKYVMPWQLAHPQGTTDECRHYLQSIQTNAADK